LHPVLPVDIIASCGREHEGWLAWHTLATLAYIIERQSSVATARSFWIITRNESDFAASPVGALSPEAFLAHYPLP
jgi:hypothetical protein